MTKEGLTTLKTISVFAPLLILTGCAGGWYKAGSTEADFYRDRYECDQQSLVMYPVMLSSGSGYQAATTTTNCRQIGTQVSCTTQPAAAIVAPPSDANVLPRLSAFQSCMRSKGYQFKMK